MTIRDPELISLPTRMEPIPRFAAADGGQPVGNVIMKPFNGLAFPANFTPSPTTTEKATMDNTNSSATPSNPSSDKIAQLDMNNPSTAADPAAAVLEAIAQTSKATSRYLTYTRRAGQATGAVAVGALCGYGIRSHLIAEAAAAQAAGGVVVTEGGVVVASETAGVLLSARTVLLAPKALLGVTLPLWGWVAAAAGAVGLSYAGWRYYQKRQLDKALNGETAKEAQAQKSLKDAGIDQPAAAKVSFTGYARAFGGGFADGAVSTGAIAGGVLLLGTWGAAAIAKSTALFGVKYGPVLAIGGTAVAATAGYQLLDRFTRGPSITLRVIHERPAMAEAPAAA